MNCCGFKGIIISADGLSRIQNCFEKKNLQGFQNLAGDLYNLI